LLAALSAPDLTLSAPLLTASRVLLIAASAVRLESDDKSFFYKTKISIKSMNILNIYRIFGPISCLLSCIYITEKCKPYNSNPTYA
jgi:hypothetical protein